MSLFLGQAVYSTEGVFGEVGAIVVDPLQRKVTHLVVEPENLHHQARLVPIWLVTVENGAVKVSMSTPYMRQLQRIAPSDFVQWQDEIQIGDQWAVDRDDVVALPYWDADGFAEELGPSKGARTGHGRIPKGECEIRRKSEVTTADYHVVGHVDGFLAEGDHLVAVVIRVGVPGRRHHVVVPMSSVQTVLNDEIILSIDRAVFNTIPRASGIVEHDELSRLEIQRRAGKVIGEFRGGAGKLAGRTRAALDRRQHRSGQ